MFKKKFPSLSSLGSDGNTSFLRAARAGNLEKVLEHLRQNIDINTSNANGLNALHLASKDGHVAVVSELLKRGAIVDAATKKGNTALHIASLAGQEEVVKLLVQHGAAVNVQSQNGFTPLYMAAQENHDSVVKYLLANGANQSLATEDGFTPLAVAMQQGHDKVVAVLLENDTRGKVRLPALHIAAKKDDVKAAKLLLENEHNPDVTSKSGFTPLHIASHYGNESIANLLIQKGADVNYAAKHNITPLHVAAKWGKTNMVALLLDKGANIEAKTRDGLTPLHCAARSGHEQVVDMLLERGAPISSKTKNGLAPLHMAAQGEHVEAARILLYHRAPVDEVTVDYLTALHVAAHCGHVRVAKLLLDRQADANARALNGFTPLHIACKKNRIKVVELLLKHGASISATTESGLTPLHVASFMGCMNIVIYLLQHEANPDVPTVRGETPLHLAARANQTDIIRILLRNGAQVDARAREQQTPLHIASRLGNVDIVMLLLQHGAQVDTTTKDMYTALHIAAKEGQDEVASVLLENGASLNATTKKGFTPLHLAAKYGNMKVAKLLLQREAAVDAQGKNGVTPLHVASHYDHQNVALLLLDKGASPHATAKNGHTPLHIAARKNQMDIATTLLEYGAKANAESKSGFTPLHLSSQEGHLDMSSLLIEHKADTNHHAKNGLAPMHLCAQEDRVNVAQVLLKNGAEVDAQTKAGYTPLHVAAHFGQANMVRFLLQNNANVNATTAIGYTPLHQAAQQGHTHIVNILLENGANPNALTNNGQTAHSIAQKLGYIIIQETLKNVTDLKTTPTAISEEKYRVVAPEAMHETFMSDSEEEGGEDTMLSDQPYRYLTVDEMKSLGDDSLPIDVTRDERMDSNRMAVSGDQNLLPPQAMDDAISPQHINQNYTEYATNKYLPDNIDIKHPVNVGKLHWKNFLVSFLVDARGGAMRGCRHSGVRVIVPPRCAAMPTRITCRYVKPQRTPHPPPLMEGEALASRVLELGPVGAKFLGPVIIEVPHFAALRGKEREIVILRSDNGETWREHVMDASEDIVQDVLNESFEAEDLSQLEDISSGRITRILTHDFPQYFAVVSRIRQEVHAIGPEGGMVSSSVVPQVQAVFPQGALTKKIKVGLQAQPIDPDLTAKLLGHGVAVSPVVTVEPRRRKFHKAITLSMPAPRAHTQGMINQYSGSAPTLRLLCSITGGTTRAQWEDVTGSTPLTFVNDCVSFTTTVSARFWLMDCRNIGDATKMATELYREAIHVPFMAKFVVFAKRVDTLEARLRVFCMTDDKEDKTLEQQEHFTEVAKSRDVEVLEGKPQYIEFAGNLVPVTKSGEQLQFAFRAFRENRLPFTVRVKDQHADTVGRCLFMREPKVAKGEPPQQPICVLNIVLPDNIVAESYPVTEPEILKKYGFIKDGGLDVYQRTELRLSDMSNLLGEDWPALATELGLSTSQINIIKSEYPDSLPQQAQSMLRHWRIQCENKAQGNTLELALKRIGRSDIIAQCLNYDVLDQAVARVKKDQGGFDNLKDELGPSRDASLRRNISLDNTYEEQDMMKESESIESLVQERKDSYDKDSRLKNISERDENKYIAEEKAVEEESGVDEKEINKSVAERRKEIEKRLSSDREIPPSIQKHEIVQEISTIKRHSLIDDKIKYNEQIIEEKKVPDKLKDEQPEKTTRVSPPKTTEKLVHESIEETVQNQKDIADNELAKKLAEQKQKIETAGTQEPTVTERTTIVKETKEKSDDGKITTVTTKTTTISTHKVSEMDDSTLLKDITQELERLDSTVKPQPTAPEDLKSPKISKTPPPSPADFLRDNQEWSPASVADIDKQYATSDAVSDKGVSQQGELTSPVTTIGEDKNDLLPYDVKQTTKELIAAEINTEISQKNKSLVDDTSDSLDVDKNLKDRDNKKEKGKKSKGFFGTLKSFAKKSFEHSDTENERSPKKQLEHAEKRTEDMTQENIKEQSPKKDEKYVTEPLEKHIKIQITPESKDFIEGKETAEIKIEAEEIVDNVISEVQKSTPLIDKMTDKKDISIEMIDEKVAGLGTGDNVLPEDNLFVVTTITAPQNGVVTQDKTKIHSMTTDFIQNEINFQGWFDKTAEVYKPKFTPVDEDLETNKTTEASKPAIDTKQESIETDDDSKLTDSESKSSGFFGLFTKKKKKSDSDREKSIEKDEPGKESPVFKKKKAKRDKSKDKRDKSASRTEQTPERTDEKNVKETLVLEDVKKETAEKKPHTDSSKGIVSSVKSFFGSSTEKVKSDIKTVKDETKDIGHIDESLVVTEKIDNFTHLTEKAAISIQTPVQDKITVVTESLKEAESDMKTVSIIATDSIETNIKDTEKLPVGKIDSVKENAKKDVKTIKSEIQSNIESTSKEISEMEEKFEDKVTEKFDTVKEGTKTSLFSVKYLFGTGKDKVKDGPEKLTEELLTKEKENEQLIRETTDKLTEVKTDKTEDLNEENESEKTESTKESLKSTLSPVKIIFGKSKEKDDPGKKTEISKEDVAERTKKDKQVTEQVDSKKDESSKSSLSTVKGFFSKSKDKVKDNEQKLTKEAKQIIEDAEKDVKESKTVTETITGTISGIDSVLADTVNGISERIDDTTTDIRKTITDDKKKPLTSVKEFFKSNKEKTKEQTADISKESTEIITETGTDAVSKTETIIAETNETSSKIKETKPENKDSIDEGKKGALSSVKEFFKPAKEKVKEESDKIAKDVEKTSRKTEKVTKEIERNVRIVSETVEDISKETKSIALETVSDTISRAEATMIELKETDLKLKDKKPEKKDLSDESKRGALSSVKEFFKPAKEKIKEESEKILKDTEKVSKENEKDVQMTDETVRVAGKEAQHFVSETLDDAVMKIELEIADIKVINSKSKDSKTEKKDSSDESKKGALSSVKEFFKPTKEKIKDESEKIDKITEKDIKIKDIIVETTTDNAATAEALIVGIREVDTKGRDVKLEKKDSPDEIKKGALSSVKEFFKPAKDKIKDESDNIAKDSEKIAKEVEKDMKIADETIKEVSKGAKDTITETVVDVVKTGSLVTEIKEIDAKEKDKSEDTSDEYKKGTLSAVKEFFKPTKEKLKEESEKISKSTEKVPKEIEKDAQIVSETIEDLTKETKDIVTETVTDVVVKTESVITEIKESKDKLEKKDSSDENKKGALSSVKGFFKPTKEKVKQDSEKIVKDTERITEEIEKDVQITHEIPKDFAKPSKTAVTEIVADTKSPITQIKNLKDSKPEKKDSSDENKKGTLSSVKEFFKPKEKLKEEFEKVGEQIEKDTQIVDDTITTKETSYIVTETITDMADKTKSVIAVPVKEIGSKSEDRSLEVKDSHEEGNKSVLSSVKGFFKPAKEKVKEESERISKNTEKAIKEIERDVQIVDKTVKDATIDTKQIITEDITDMSIKTETVITEIKETDLKLKSKKLEKKDSNDESKKGPLSTVKEFFKPAKEKVKDESEKISKNAKKVVEDIEREVQIVDENVKDIVIETKDIVSESVADIANKTESVITEIKESEDSKLEKKDSSDESKKSALSTVKEFFKPAKEKVKEETEKFAEDTEKVIKEIEKDIKVAGETLKDMSKEMKEIVTETEVGDVTAVTETEIAEVKQTDPQTKDTKPEKEDSADEYKKGTLSSVKEFFKPTKDKVKEESEKISKGAQKTVKEIEKDIQNIDETIKGVSNETNEIVNETESIMTEIKETDLKLKGSKPQKKDSKDESKKGALSTVKEFFKPAKEKVAEETAKIGKDSEKIAKEIEKDIQIINETIKDASKETKQAVTGTATDAVERIDSAIIEIKEIDSKSNGEKLEKKESSDESKKGPLSSVKEFFKSAKETEKDIKIVTEITKDVLDTIDDAVTKTEPLDVEAKEIDSTERKNLTDEPKCILGKPGEEKKDQTDDKKGGPFIKVKEFFKPSTEKVKEETITVEIKTDVISDKPSKPKKEKEVEVVKKGTFTSVKEIFIPARDEVKEEIEKINEEIKVVTETEKLLDKEITKIKDNKTDVEEKKEITDESKKSPFATVKKLFKSTEEKVKDDVKAIGEDTNQTSRKIEKDITTTGETVIETLTEKIIETESTVSEALDSASSKMREDKSKAQVKKESKKDRRKSPLKVVKELFKSSEEKLKKDSEKIYEDSKDLSEHAKTDMQSSIETKTEIIEQTITEAHPIVTDALTKTKEINVDVTNMLYKKAAEIERDIKTANKDIAVTVEKKITETGTELTDIMDTSSDHLKDSSIKIKTNVEKRITTETEKIDEFLKSTINQVEEESGTAVKVSGETVKGIEKNFENAIGVVKNAAFKTESEAVKTLSHVQSELENHKFESENYLNETTTEIKTTVKNISAPITEIDNTKIAKELKTNIKTNIEDITKGTQKEIEQIPKSAKEITENIENNIKKTDDIIMETIQPKITDISDTLNKTSSKLVSGKSKLKEIDDKSSEHKIEVSYGVISKTPDHFISKLTESKKVDIDDKTKLTEEQKPLVNEIQVQGREFFKDTREISNELQEDIKGTVSKSTTVITENIGKDHTKLKDELLDMRNGKEESSTSKRFTSSIVTEIIKPIETTVKTSYVAMTKDIKDITDDKKVNEIQIKNQQKEIKQVAGEITIEDLFETTDLQKDHKDKIKANAKSMEEQLDHILKEIEAEKDKSTGKKIESETVRTVKFDTTQISSKKVDEEPVTKHDTEMSLDTTVVTFDQKVEKIKDILSKPGIQITQVKTETISFNPDYSKITKSETQSFGFHPLEKQKDVIITDLDDIPADHEIEIQEEFSHVDRILSSVDDQLEKLQSRSKIDESSFSDKRSKSDVLDKAKTMQTSKFFSQEFLGNIQHSNSGLEDSLNMKSGATMISEKNIDLSHIPLSEQYDIKLPKNPPVILTRLGDTIIIDDPEYDSDSTTQEKDTTKKKPIFHIESEEQEEESDKKESPTDDIITKVTETLNKSDEKLMEIKKESEKEVKKIESKISEMDTLLENLEKTDVEGMESHLKERKLHRVERRFERMASETLEHEKREAKIETPELEKKNEDEFQKIVRQLSMEEISDCQKEYSALWEEGTFSPSDELESKTPDSTAEIQDLPQGCYDIVYMAPVTLNKDQNINKAGIEIDIIPIKRSPYSSPTFQRKNHRLISETDQQSSSSNIDINSSDLATNLRASLPNIYNPKQKEVNTTISLPTERIVRTFLNINNQQRNIDTMSQSTECLITKQKDSDTNNVHSSVNQGSIMSAVLSWLSQSSLSSTKENYDSNETITDSMQTSLMSTDNSSDIFNFNYNYPYTRDYKTARKSPSIKHPPRTPCALDQSPLGGTETEQEKSEEKTDEKETEEVKSESEEKQTTGRPRPAGSQHELSEEMRALLAEMEEQSKR